MTDLLIAFEENNYIVGEDDGSVMFCAEVCQGISSRNASFAIHPLKGSAYCMLSHVHALFIFTDLVV